MPDKDKPLRPKLIVPGAERGEKKGRPVVAADTESSKQQVLVPQSKPSPEARAVVPGLPEEAEPQLTVQLSGLPAEQPDAGLPEVVDMGPAPEEDGIVDIVGTIGVAEEVIAELDEVAQREEQARIAEAERVRIAEAERAEAEAQALAEEEERVRAEAQAQAARQQQAPAGQAQQQAPAGQAQQGYPMSPAGQPYPGQAYGAAGEGMHGAVGMQVKSPSGIPGWAIYMIGFLSGALILLILFMATPMGEGLIGKSLMKKGWRKMENPGKSRRSSSGAVQSATFSQPGSVE